MVANGKQKFLPSYQIHSVLGPSILMHIPCILYNLLFRSPRRRWEDNIKVDLQKVGCGVMDWIELAQDRNRWRALVNAVMNLQVP